jgi:hypothetical protein
MDELRGESDDVVGAIIAESHCRLCLPFRHQHPSPSLLLTILRTPSQRLRCLHTGCQSEMLACVNWQATGPTERVRPESWRAVACKAGQPDVYHVELQRTTSARSNTSLVLFICSFFFGVVIARAPSLHASMLFQTFTALSISGVSGSTSSFAATVAKSRYHSHGRAFKSALRLLCGVEHSGSTPLL